MEGCGCGCVWVEIVNLYMHVLESICFGKTVRTLGGSLPCVGLLVRLKDSRYCVYCPPDLHGEQKRATKNGDSCSVTVTMHKKARSAELEYVCLTYYSLGAWFHMTPRVRPRCWEESHRPPFPRHRVS